MLATANIKKINTLCFGLQAIIRSKTDKFFHLSSFWAYVVFASLVDLIFSMSWHESIHAEPIFGLSDSLGELGKKRQERLSCMIVVFFFFIGIFCTILLRLKYGNTQRWIASALLTGASGLAVVVIAILTIHNKKRK